MQPKTNVAVIGAGIAGLSTAAILSHRGARCTVVEKSPSPGGRASWIEKNGFIIDFGIHVNRYADQGKAADVLRAIGDTPRFLPTGTPLFYTGKKLVPLPKGPLKILTTPLLSFRSRLRLLRMFVTIIKSKDITDIHGVSVEQWLEREGIDRPDIVDLVRLLCGSGLVCPNIEKAAAAELFHFLTGALKARHATGYALGGWPGIFGKLEAAVREKGEILYGTAADEIIVEAGRATGVRCGETVVSADAVVSTVPLENLTSILPPDALPKDVLETMTGIEPTCGISYDACLRTRVSDINGIILTLDPCTMGMFTSNVEPSVAPRGKQLLTWFYPIPREMMDRRDMLRREKKRLKDIIEKIIPGVAEAVEFERFLEMRLVDGAMPSVGQTGRDRPKVDCPLPPNLFIAGDAMGVEGHGGDVAFSSALACAELVHAELAKNRQKT